MFGSSSGASEIFNWGNFLLKIQTIVLFTKIDVFLMYREIYVHIFAITKHYTAY